MNPIALTAGLFAAVLIWSMAALYIARHWLAKSPPYISVPTDGDGEYES